MLSDNTLVEIADRIRRQGYARCAFCVDEEKPTEIYFVPDVGFQPGTPDSCLIRLVQEMVSVWKPEWKGWNGYSKRYFCKTGPANEMEQGMLAFVYPGCQVKGNIPARQSPLRSLSVTQLGGTHFNSGLQSPFANLIFSHKADYILRGQDRQLRKVHRIYMMAAYALLNSGKVTRSYNVAAILVGPDGRIISYGVNQSYKHYTFHAEVLALQSCLRNGIAIPAQSILYTTLQPCCMCGGMVNFCMQQGMVIYNVKDAHNQGTSYHMNYRSALPMHELGVFAKQITTWKSGRVYDRIGKQRSEVDALRRHRNLGTEIGREHRSLESRAGKRYSIIQYLNKEGNEFVAEGSDALTRKKEKYRFKGKRVPLDPYVLEALNEALAFLEHLRVPVLTVQEERADQIVDKLAQQFRDKDARLWPMVYDFLLSVIGDAKEFDEMLRDIEQAPEEFLEGFEKELWDKDETTVHRGALFYS